MAAWGFLGHLGLGIVAATYNFKRISLNELNSRRVDFPWRALKKTPIRARQKLQKSFRNISEKLLKSYRAIAEQFPRRLRKLATATTK